MSRKWTVCAGQRYGRLTVRSLYGTNHNKKREWLCECDCGDVARVISQSLTNGTTRSCGCLMREVISDQRKSEATHGNTRGGKETRTYRSWRSMMKRCYNKNTKDFSNYGGRGITVCERWRNSFESFLSDMGERPESKTLDRIDVNGNYEPSNCRWATHVEQSYNKRISKLTPQQAEDIGGDDRDVSTIAKEYGITKAHVSTIRHRHKMRRKRYE